MGDFFTVQMVFSGYCEYGSDRTSHLTQTYLIAGDVNRIKKKYIATNNHLNTSVKTGWTDE